MKKFTRQKREHSALVGLTATDRFILRFFARRGSFVPYKGLQIRTREQLDAKIAELGPNWKTIVLEV